MKEFEGKKVWLRPTGNFAYMGRTIEEAIILKVARVNATFKILPSGREEKYSYRGNRLSNQMNAGYKVYATKQEILDEEEAETLASLIYENFRYPSCYQRLPLEKLQQIVEIMGLKPVSEEGEV